MVVRCITPGSGPACRAGVDLAGENGEYHSVVVGGPVFSSALEVTFGEPLLRDGVWFVDAWPTPSTAPG